MYAKEKFAGIAFMGASQSAQRQADRKGCAWWKGDKIPPFHEHGIRLLYSFGC